MGWLPYNLSDSEPEVGAETFQYFHLKGVFPKLEFILECKKFVCGS
jgi:hypothetical protein